MIIFLPSYQTLGWDFANNGTIFIVVYLLSKYSIHLPGFVKTHNTRVLSVRVSVAPNPQINTDTVCGILCVGCLSQI